MERKTCGLSDLFNEILVYYDNQIVSGSRLLQAMLSFMENHTSKENHNVNMILHTGSKLFDIAAITYAAFSNITFDNLTTQNVIEEINVNDLVIYKGKKYKFLGKSIIKGNNYCCLEEKDKTTLKLPEAFWNQIAPYKGHSANLGGQGIKSKGNNLFLNEVSKLLGKEIPVVTGTSSIFVMPKKEVLDLTQYISFSLNGESARLTEFSPAAYFTSEDNYLQLGVNPLKTEPNLKFTSKISVARKLIKNTEGNKKLSFYISDKDLIRRYYSELIDLLHKKTLSNNFIRSKFEFCSSIKIR